MNQTDLAIIAHALECCELMLARSKYGDLYSVRDPLDKAKMIVSARQAELQRRQMKKLIRKYSQQ